MESSQVYGGAEECHSSESGWTMYIGSPTTYNDYQEQQEQEQDDNLNSNNNVNHGGSYSDEADTDDSMASDASSGPSHWLQQPASRNKNNGYNNIHKKSCSSTYKPSKYSSSVMKMMKKKKNNEEKKEVHQAATANSPKSFWKKGKTGK